jgi:hypothetical protein
MQALKEVQQSQGGLFNDQGVLLSFERDTDNHDIEALAAASTGAVLCDRSAIC